MLLALALALVLALALAPALALAWVLPCIGLDSSCGPSFASNALELHSTAQNLFSELNQALLGCKGCLQVHIQQP